MKQTIETWKRTSSKQIADCRVFRVREDFCERSSDNTTGTFFVIENPDWVNVIALTKEKKVVLIEQFRHGTGEITLEIPGGMMDTGESPETAAQRELAEETGYTSETFISLGKSRPNPALQNNWIYHYLAVDCEKTTETSFDEHESIVAKLVGFNKIPELISTEQITNSLVLTAFYMLSIHRNFATARTEIS